MQGDQISRFGFFGKIPALGDFAHWNVAKSFVGPWDRWLQDGLLLSREHLGQHWTEAYMHAPIWRFTLSGGLAGANPALGVLMPSVDRVGRQFPLTLVTPVPGSDSPFSDHFKASDVFLGLESIALAALDDEFGREQLQSALSTMSEFRPDPPSTIRTAQGTLVLSGSANASADFGEALAQGQFRSPSVWSCQLDGVETMMACEGLPRSGQMTGLFDLSAPVWSAVEMA